MDMDIIWFIWLLIIIISCMMSVSTVKYKFKNILKGIMTMQRPFIVKWRLMSHNIIIGFLFFYFW